MILTADQYIELFIESLWQMEVFVQTRPKSFSTGSQSFSKAPEAIPATSKGYYRHPDLSILASIFFRKEKKFSRQRNGHGLHSSTSCLNP